MGLVEAKTRIGDFELLGKLGEGGMGAVYKARQLSLDRIVALKVLPPKAAEDAEYLQRFFREARATARLNHPNIVKSIAVGTFDGYSIFAMEYVEGSNLKQRICEEGALPEDEVAELGAAIASALAHVHAAGVIHRDVKPENILIDLEGTPKLSDLGLVSMDGDGSLTQSGYAVGTPHYMAPEQVRGDANFDSRADIYSLGCTLYHAATGKTPFEGATPGVLMVKHLQEKMPHPQSIRAELSDPFCAIVDRMVARKPEDRCASMDEVSADLRMLLDGQASECRIPSGRSSFSQSERRPATTTVRRTAPHAPAKAPVSSAVRKRAAAADAAASSKGRNWSLIAGAGLAVLLAAGAVLCLLLRKGS